MLFLVLSLASSCLASLHSSIPEDLYAFPKYRVSFLNGLPVSNHTAERWLRDGLQGGEAEFLDRWHPKPLHEIDSGDSPSAVSTHDDHRSDQHTASSSSPPIEHMRLGPSKSYVCLIPPAPTLPPPPPDEGSTVVTPGHSWSLLQPLSGTCLYHRQGWFTYSYCHNLHVRQFRELPATYPHPPGARVIEEDPEWESYTLGKSSHTSSGNVGGELALNDEVASANSLQLARQAAGQRYLVQRWSDGTICDKTGHPREIEVQFHCSMTMTDTIMFVKETRTCEYVLVIHTPRLCGEPGFKSRLAQIPEAEMPCREVVDDVDAVDSTLLEGSHPLHAKPQRPIPAPSSAPPASSPPRPLPGSPEGDKPSDATGRTQENTKLLRLALESLLNGGEDMGDMPVFELQRGEQEGEFFITRLDPDEEGEGLPPATDEPVSTGRGQTLAEILRAAGIDVKGLKAQNVFKEQPDDQNEEKRDERKDERKPHEEL